MHYKITKIGLLNFWLYDEEEFEFSDGKLLLRGKNGSGKSVTMQSFIPLILDGNKSPSRLDPFGSTDKHIEAYLLGGIDTEQKEEATGYLYMEVYYEEKKKYVTIGMGLHARRGRPVEFYGFALQDGRRIKKDFFLYKNKSEKVPLSKNELRSSLGPSNLFVETTKEYKKMVNQLLFGFHNLDSYDEFINVLLQLRSPKLSKEYKPTRLMAILSSVLQPLTEEDLRPLSDAIEEMDKTKEKIEQLEKDVKQLSYLIKSYNNYNEAILYKKAKRYQDNKTSKNNLEKDVKTIKKKIEEEEKKLEEQKEQLKALEIKLQTTKTKKEHFDSKDLEFKISRVEALTREIEEKKKRRENYQDEIQKKSEKKNILQKEILSYEDYLYQIEKEIDDMLLDIDALSDDTKFTEPSLMLKDLKKDKQYPIDFSQLLVRTKNYQNKVRNMKEYLSQKKEQEEKISEHQAYYDSLNKEYQDHMEELEKIEDEIEETLLTLKDEILFLQKSNQVIKLLDDEKNTIFSYLTTYEKENYEKAKEIYLSLAKKYYQDALREESMLNEKIRKQKEKIKEEEILLEQLKEKEEDEIPLDEEQQQTNLFLEQENIVSLPFYKGVEFRENLSSDVKDHLESSLFLSGILSANMIRGKDIEKVKGHTGSYLFKTTKKKDNLTKYLKAVEMNGMKKEEIEEILESISISNNDLVNLVDKNYQFDFLMGYSSNTTKAKYIGILSRIEEQKRKIAEQEKKIDTEKQILETEEAILNTKKQEIEEIEREQQRFPSNQKIEKIEERRKEIIIQMNMINQNQLKEEESIRFLNKELDDLMKKINEKKKDFLLPLSFEVFKEVEKNMESFVLSLMELETKVKEYDQKSEISNSKKEQKEELEGLLDDVIVELDNILVEIKKQEQEKQDLEQMLQTDEYRDLSRELLKLQADLESIPKEQIRLSEEQGKSRVELENDKKNLIELEEKLVTEEKRLSLYRRFFEEEYQLHYVMEEETDTDTLVKVVLEKLSARKDSDMDNINNNYYSAYHDYRNSLQEYHLTTISLFERKEVEEEFRQLYDEAKRNDFRVVYQGKQLNLYALTKTLEEAILENHQIISEQDRKIFEDILLKTVGSKIRQRIEASKNWVKEMNDIMKTMQQDSALSFQLEWRSKSAMEMEELDTKELVRIFKIPADMISPSDSEKLIRHFRSKLKKKVDLEEENHDTYANIIFEILDYREWFEFKMLYQRTSENKKELTDKVFSVFSGGEKAKAMYIPLFAAVYAKLLGARKEALRIVALDEAFAGVDDNNIREMFGIMSYLDLDYILTSQALWGDYDTVSDLAIVELLRPMNSQVVGLRRYHWNGKVKEVILKKKEEEEDAIKLF